MSFCSKIVEHLDAVVQMKVLCAFARSKCTCRRGDMKC